MNDSELSDFTKLVLARLETNPDEFQLGGRWDTLVRGIEAYVRGDKDDRYYRTLWLLDDPEIHVIVAAYRKAYLKMLHRDMLKNIVSGDDKESYNIALDRGYKLGSGRAAPQNSGLGTISGGTYTSGLTDTHALYNAVVKQEGAQIAPPPKVSRYLLTPAQVAVAQKMGMDPADYAKHVDRFQG